MKRVINGFFGLLIAAVTLLFTWTCRRRALEDSRPGLRQAGQRYVFAARHAHQAACVFFNDERRLAAMVSRSTDGDLLVPSLRARRVIPVRGSSARNGKDKGGAKALVRMIRLVRDGVVGIITVDGPRGPRNTVHDGIVRLAEKTDAVIVPVVIIPSMRFILKRTWDRMQIPKPFARLDYAFGPPIDPREFDERACVQTAVAKALDAMESRYDAKEFQLSQPMLMEAP